MVKGQRFCGKCGAKGDEEHEMVKCSSCTGEMMKAHVFCPACGTKANTPDKELDDFLAGVPMFQKARIDKEAELEVLPIVEAGDVDHTAIDQVLLKAKIPDEAGNINALPILEEQLHGVNTLSAQIRTNAEHNQAWNRHHAAGIAEMMKATVLLARRVVGQEKQIEMLKASVETLAATPRGRRIGQPQLEVAPRRAPGEGQLVTGDPGDDLRGEKLFLKAKTGYVKDPTLQNAGAIASLETYKAMNASAAEVAANDAPLGEWLQRCLTAAA
jgi:hypothetical protein